METELQTSGPFKRKCGWTALLCAVVLSGCDAPEKAPAGSVAAAWQRRDQAGAASASLSNQQAVTNRQVLIPRDTEAKEPTIATVNGRPVARRRVLDLLLKARGVEVLEQLIGLEAAATAAANAGLTVTQADVDREYEQALRNLADPLSSVTPKPFDRKAAERLLKTVLSQRNVSREEFDIITQRNAYLRKIVGSQQVLTEQQLRREFDRLYGKRVQVRHIQLGTLAEVARVKERLTAGEDFAELAGRYSANTASARSEGLLDPFSAGDEEVPALLREAAFSLEPGQVSDAVRIGEWYHLVKVERLLPAVEKEFEQVRAELERSARRRMAAPAMYELFESLFREATIEIHDPALAEAFHRKHEDRARRATGSGRLRGP
ncbi:MAG: peptidylprolyl isomerase [Phycisphaerales bacterium]|nr:MAG: peptidylprolyl isomerase [Phycisphaerales bacterium]